MFLSSTLYYTPTLHSNIVDALSILLNAEHCSMHRQLSLYAVTGSSQHLLLFVRTPT